MKKRKHKPASKERIKQKTKIIEKDLEGGTRKIYHMGFWKDEEVLHGSYKEYYEAMEITNRPKEFSKFKYGVLHGKFEKWFEDGYKATEGIYNNGRKTGQWKTWFDNGGIESLINFKDGKKSGKVIEYYRDGGKASESIYKENRKVNEIGQWEFEEMKDVVPIRERLL